MKKGQTTMFVIIGMVILAFIFLLIYMSRQGFFFGPVTHEDLRARLDSIRDHINGCAEKIAPDYLKRLGLQGGHLKTPDGTYRMYEGITVSYLCYAVPNTPRCYNRLLLLGDMEKELNEAVKEGLTTCVNVKQFARGLDVSFGKLKVDTHIGTDSVIFDVIFPVTLTKGDLEISEDKFSSNIDVPLGALYDVSQDIINDETEFGNFEQLTYMLVKKGQYIIEKKKPYPDKIYILKTKDKDYVFQFFVQGEPT